LTPEGCSAPNSHELPRAGVKSNSDWGFARLGRSSAGDLAGVTGMEMTLGLPLGECVSSFRCAGAVVARRSWSDEMIEQRRLGADGGQKQSSDTAINVRVM